MRRKSADRWRGVAAAIVVVATAGPILLFLASESRAQTAGKGTIRFRNVARQSGIDFVLENDPTPRKHLIETMAGGVAAFDYDSDGLTDVYFANGARSPSLQKDSPRFRNRLFRNMGGMKFRDVTEEAGVAGSGYSTAVAAGDFNNDGHADLFVGGVRENTLYLNTGSGRFRDVTRSAGITSGPWSEGAVWVDFNNDGWLDLFVVNYVRWTGEFDVFCGDRAANIRSYCHPRLFEGLPNALYQNKGDGTFADVSAKSGISKHVGKGMSAVIADYDHDGYSDIFVTNDKLPNFLFHNKRDGTFEEVGLETGIALQDSGTPVSGMGADFRDYNNDGHPDIAFAALAGETFPLFLNDGKGSFRDAGHTTRMAPLTHDKSGWSIGLFDLNNDGWKDVFTSNGHVNDTVESFEATKYKLTNTVFSNSDSGVVRDVSKGSGLDAEEPHAHRGCAFADFNNDGKIDVVVVALGAPAELWENITDGGGSWVTFRLKGRKSNRDGIGADIRVGNQQNHMTTSVGYMSSSHFGAHFGVPGTGIPRVEVRWPSGVRQVLENVGVNRVVPVAEP
jgi:hypothetical protein